MHGGKRAGSGRPPGRRNDKTLMREILRHEAAERCRNQTSEMTPLDIILEVARVSFAVGDYAIALAASREALPYLASKLAPSPAIDPNRGTVDEIANDPDPFLMD